MLKPVLSVLQARGSNTLQLWNWGTQFQLDTVYHKYPNQSIFYTQIALT